MKESCCVMCRESLNDNYCNLPNCKCHTPPNNTHQQPSSKEWEKRVVELQFKTMLSRDMPEVAKKYHQEMIDFIQSLLTSHSQAIRERVMKLEYEENDADGNHSYDRARQKEGYYYAKDDILALLTDEV